MNYRHYKNGQTYEVMTHTCMRENRQPGLGEASLEAWYEPTGRKITLCRGKDGFWLPTCTLEMHLETLIDEPVLYTVYWAGYKIEGETTCRLWVRPTPNFFEPVEYAGSLQPRFAQVTR